jgi:hypothetical protein
LARRLLFDMRGIDPAASAPAPKLAAASAHLPLQKLDGGRPSAQQKAR